MRWERNHVGRHPQGTHTLELVMYTRAYSGEPSFSIRCRARQRGFFGLGKKRDVVEFVQTFSFDSGGGTWYCLMWGTREEAATVLEVLRNARAAEEVVVDSVAVKQGSSR